MSERSLSENVAARSVATATGTAVVHLTDRLEIVSHNAWTGALLPFGDLGGQSIEDVLRKAENSGLFAGGAGAQVLAMLREKRTSIVFDMRDGRKILATGLFDSDRITLELTDVSAVVALTLKAQQDVLTGLPNRLALLTSLQDALASGSSSATGAALLYIDLDRFKVVNDTLGYSVGDELLKLASQRMTTLLAPGDLLARIGDDEFVIFQTQAAQPRAAADLAERVIELVGRTYLIRGQPVLVGASVGIALASTHMTADALIKNANLSLSKAKSAGRGMAMFFTDEMDQKIQTRRVMEIDLRRALALQEFTLAYQPQFLIDGTRLVGFEALLRWTSDSHGVVSPAQFVPLAEEIGMIAPLGEWVLRTACLEAAKWPDMLSISVNLSPLQFRSPQLVSVIASALAKAGLDPTRLELEITEGALMDDTDAVVATLQQIKALGVKVSMDDFGTGYSSLSYLQRFPFDKLKIDQSFVRSIGTNPDSAAIVRAVTTLAHSLGMVTIAEGVETQEQLVQLARDGCQQVQGFLTGRPLTANAAGALANPVFAKE